LTQEQLAKELAVLAKASGVSQEELMSMLQTAGMSKSGLAALQPAILAAYNEPVDSSENDDEVAAALAKDRGEGVLPLAGIGLGPLIGLGAGVVALAAAGGSDGSTPLTVVTGSDGPLSNAVIRNTDGTLLGTTDSTGNLAVPSALLTPGSVLTLTTVPGSTVDVSTGNPVRFEVTFKALVPASGPVIISPISTLIVDGVSVDSLSLALGLPAGFSLAGFNSSATLANDAQNPDAASVASFSSGLMDLIEHASKEAGFELPAGFSITTALAQTLNNLLSSGFTSTAVSQSAALIRELTIKFLTDNGVDNPGHVQAIADQIAQGVAIVESSLSDGYSASPDQPVLAQVDIANAGMNTAAELVAVSNPAGIIESASTGAQSINVSGALTVEDNDAGDSIVGSVVGNAQIVYSGGGLPAGVEISALGLASALVFSPVIANTNDQSLPYVYNPSATDFSFLAEGQSLTITYQVQVTDDQFQSGSKPLIITITGTNNAPVVITATGQDLGAVSEAGNVDNGAVVANIASASGQLIASDADAMASQSWSIVGVPSSTYGNFSLTPAGAWTYSLDNALAATQALREGQTVVETFNVLVTDDFGATATETVSIVILGTNDSPVVTTVAGANQASLVEDGNLDDGTLVNNVATAGGQLTASDVDAMASQSWSIVGVPSATYGNFSLTPAGAWSYSLDNSLAATQALHEGQSVVETFNVLVTDEFGATATETVTITIAGRNDSPVLTTAVGSNQASLVEDGNLDDGTVFSSIATASGQLTVSDVDAIASQALSIVVSPSATYGEFILTPAGAWTYNLDNSLAATQALREGQSVLETFNVLVTDEFGATASETVTINIQGTNDSPVLTVVNSNENQIVLNAADVDNSPTISLQAVTGISSLSVGVDTLINLQAGASVQNIQLEVRDDFDAVSRAGTLVLGTAADDTLDASSITAGPVFVFGFDGDDLITTSTQSDTLYGGSGSDAFIFADVAQLAGDALVSGGDGTDTIQVLTAGTFVDSDFANVSSVETLKLFGASSLTLAASAQAAGISNVIAGAAATSIINNTGGVVNVDASAIPNGQVLTLGGNGSFVVTGLKADVLNTAQGALTLTLDGSSGSLGVKVDSSNAASVLINTGTFDLVDTLTLGGTSTVTVNVESTTNVFTGPGNTIFNIASGETATINASGTPFNASMVITGDGDAVVSLLQANLDASTSTGDIVVNALNGNQNITTGSGDDVINGAEGSDTINAGSGNDTIMGGEGDDTIVFADVAQLAADALVSGGGGTDTIQVLTAGTFADSDFANVSSVETLKLFGASGVTLAATAQAAGISKVIAGAGSTVITNNTGGLVTLDASAIPNGQVLTLGGSAGFVVTGLKADVLNTAQGALSLTLDGSSRGLAVKVDSSNAASVSIDTGTFDRFDTLTLLGSNAVTVNVESTTNVVTGGANTVFNIASGETATINAAATPQNASMVITGEGNAVVSFLLANLDASTSTGDIIVTALNGSQKITTGSGDDVIQGADDSDTINGGSGNDIINGGTGTDTLNGGSGNDFLNGSDGNDILDGGQGQDTLRGDAGADRFVFKNDESTVEAPDTVVDFRTNFDSLQFADVILPVNYFEAGAAVGSFADAQIAANNQFAANADLKLVFQFDADNGYLFLDSDGDNVVDQAVILIGIDNNEIAAGDIV